ncbi:MAG TPA: pyridoxal-dependent decarboxylase [Propionibacteriaceae bacterium]|nr:pyridoxal-dependent decarboxylase [Propionibacteriaceae bacterium]
MRVPEWRPALTVAHDAALDWLEHLDERSVRPDVDYDTMYAALAGPMPEGGTPAEQVIADLARTVKPGLMAMNHGRFFGWVIGGATPAGVAADWLVAAWDQNTAMAEPTPGTSAVEAVTAEWLLELLDLPRTSSVAFVTGAQVANLVCLAAARDRVLADAGWDVEADGLIGAPPVTVLAGEYVHHTVGKAVRILGLGEARIVTVPADGNARMRPDALADALSRVDGPAIVCGQGGEIATGGIDPLAAIADVVDARRATAPTWFHIDGAIGLFARASTTLAPKFAGAERADSWCTDAHKWLNTPYDCGIAIVRDREAHHRAMTLTASYLPEPGAARDPIDWNPEMSRRARATAVYATLRSLGRSGVAEIAERDCEMARLLAEGIGMIPGAEVCNEVELNQVLVRLHDPAGLDDDAHTRAVLSRIQTSGVAYPSGTTFGGRAAIRFSVANWATDETDVVETLEALADAHTRWG